MSNLTRLIKLRKKINETKHLEEQNISQYLKILKSENKKIITKSKLINLNQVRDWYIKNNGNIYHKSNQFFSIQGVRTKSAKNREVKSWDQPIFNQPHGGILAIISKVTKNKGVNFLLRTRIEPGDNGKIKFCPTFQATKSNINRAHGGKKPDFYDEVFKNKNTKKIFSTSHYEEGGRFWMKTNQNIILLTEEKFKLERKTSDCYWLSMTQIKKLSLKNNTVNPFVKTILFMI